MTVFDYSVIVIVLASLVLGAWRGVVGEIIALIAWVLAFLAAKYFGGQVAQGFLGFIVDPNFRLVCAWIIVFIVVFMLVALLRLAVRQLLNSLGLGPSDRFLGFLFGVSRGLLIVLLLVALAGFTSIPQEIWWRNAYFSRPLETVVLASKPWLPEDIAKRIQFK